MTHKIYDARRVKECVDCKRYLQDRDFVLRGNRFNATWRGGDSFSCSFDGALFFDHKESKGGSVIDLCMLVEGISTPLTAIQVLGDRYGVPALTTTREAPKRTRGEMLIDDGYTLVCTYTYEDEKGNPVYYVDRYERRKGTAREKTFVQRTNDAETIDGVERVLYNLPAVMRSERVFIVEGEKDVETLRKMNIVATTNSGGGKYWHEKFNHYFQDKDVIIIADNDEVGKEHGQVLFSFLNSIAKSCKVITISSLQHGDVTDWIEKEGGTREKLEEIVRNVKTVITEDPPDVAAAKLANSTPFSNFSLLKEGKKTVHVPVLIDTLMADLKRRFLGYPRLIGTTPFDWVRDDKKILKLPSKNDFFAWVQGCSRQSVVWETRPGFVTKEEMFSRVIQTAQAYSGIASAPHFPPRADIFYTHDELPPVDPTHDTFWRLMDFFCPKDKANRLLLAAFFCAPSFYDGKNSRPAWIIDTEDAQASGKSTIVKMCARLYNEEPLDVDIKTLDWGDSTLLTKRLLSPDGRSKRIVLLDNLTKTISGSTLAKLITAPSISGMAPYGHGEETRPNDLTYACTVNGATVDTDMATRSYTIRIRAPKHPDPNWENQVSTFIDNNRMRIFSDMRDMIEHAPQRRRIKSRFGMFDQRILSAVCESELDFVEVDKALIRESDMANEDAERAAEFEELVLNRLSTYREEDMNGLTTDAPIFIRCRDIDIILKRSSGAISKYRSANIRQLIKMGLLPNWSKKMERSPTLKNYPQTRGFLWGMDRLHEPVGGVVPDIGHVACQLSVMEDNGKFSRKDWIAIKEDRVL